MPTFDHTHNSAIKTAAETFNDDALTYLLDAHIDIDEISPTKMGMTAAASLAKEGKWGACEKLILKGACPSNALYGAVLGDKTGVIDKIRQTYFKGNSLLVITASAKKKPALFNELKSLFNAPQYFIFASGTINDKNLIQEGRFLEYAGFNNWFLAGQAFGGHLTENVIKNLLSKKNDRPFPVLFIARHAAYGNQVSLVNNIYKYATDSDKQKLAPILASAFFFIRNFSTAEHFAMLTEIKLAPTTNTDTYCGLDPNHMDVWQKRSYFSKENRLAIFTTDYNEKLNQKMPQVLVSSKNHDHFFKLLSHPKKLLKPCDLNAINKISACENTKTTLYFWMLVAGEKHTIQKAPKRNKKHRALSQIPATTDGPFLIILQYLLSKSLHHSIMQEKMPDILATLPKGTWDKKSTISCCAIS